MHAQDDSSDNQDAMLWSDKHTRSVLLNTSYTYRCLCMHLCDVVKVVHPEDLAVVLCCSQHLTLDAFVFWDGEALTHGPRCHELGAMGVMDGVLLVISTQ